MTRQELFAKIRPIIVLATGVPECILADQRSLPGGPATSPKGPYATVEPRQTVSERGQANIYTRDIPGDLIEYDVRAQIMCSVSVNFFRGEALMYAERLKQANKRPDVSMLLYKARLGWNGTDPVNNLSGLQSANIEQRAQITLRLMYEAQSLAEVNNILSVTVTTENEKAEPLQSVTVDINTQ